MNKFTTRIKQMVFLTMAVCLAVSCTEDMETSRSALNNGSTALRISFAAPDYTQVNTRSVMESGIKGSRKRAGRDYLYGVFEL